MPLVIALVMVVLAGGYICAHHHPKSGRGDESRVDRELPVAKQQKLYACWVANLATTLTLVWQETHRFCTVVTAFLYWSRQFTVVWGVALSFCAFTTPANKYQHLFSGRSYWWHVA
jgi:hypothetical protein